MTTPGWETDRDFLRKQRPFMVRFSMFLAVVFLAVDVGPGLAQPVTPPTVSVSDYTHVLRISGRNTSDLFGVSLEVIQNPASATKLVIIGSNLASDPLNVVRAGRVDLFNQTQIQSPGLIDLFSSDTQPQATFFGQLTGDRFGSRTKCGDFDGDGLLDLAVSAPYQNPLGRVYLFFGAGSLAQGSTGLWDASGVIQASSADVFIDGEVIGTGLALEAADFDSDGIDDLVIGSPSSLGEIGKVFVVHGRSQWETDPIRLVNALSMYSATYELQVRVYRGKQKDNRLGESLAVGDLNGDSKPDLLVGADNEDLVLWQGNSRSTFPKVGRVYGIYGGHIFSNPPATAEIVMATGTSDFVLTGKSEFDRFGDAMHVTKWDSNDSVDDLWISAPYAENLPFPQPTPGPNDDQGLVTLVSGGGPIVCSPSDVTSTLFCFAPNWKTMGYQPADLLSFLADKTLPALGGNGTATNEYRYPNGFDTSVFGYFENTLFGGSISDGDVLPDEPLSELLVGASLSINGSVSILSRSDLQGATPGTPRELFRTPETLRVVGERAGDRFGFRVESADLFEDPGEELIVTAPGGGIADRASGMVYIFNAHTLLVGDATATEK